MSDKDLVELKNAVEYFELQLKKKYSTKDLNTAYLTYLESMYSREFDESFLDFYLDKGAIDILERLKISKTFDKIWISLSTAVSELKDENGKPILNDSDNEKLVIINKYGDYQKCVKESTNNKAIVDYVNFEIENVGLSFPISARNLHKNLRPKDLNDDLNKLVITLGFYYEYVYMMNNYYRE